MNSDIAALLILIKGILLFLSIIGIVAGTVMLIASIKKDDLGIRVAGGIIVGLCTFILVMIVLFYPDYKVIYSGYRG